MLLRGRPASASGMTPMPSPANPTAAPQGRLRRQGPEPGARRPAVFRRICAIAVAAAIPALAGCEAGLNAPVLQWHTPVNGTNKTLRPRGAPATWGSATCSCSVPSRQQLPGGKLGRGLSWPWSTPAAGTGC